MKEAFLAHIRTYTRITLPIRDFLLKEIEMVEYKKNEVILKEGRRCFYIWFINKGSVRTYYAYKNKEITSWIYKEHEIVTSIETIGTSSPSVTSIQATEDTQLARLSLTKLEELYILYPHFQSFGRKWAQETIAAIAYVYRGYDFMSPKEKYDLLLTIFPDVTQRVNLGHIASFIGITQETLSRLRKL
jgi:CRP-like cAMP-binding protein